jgi:hypothetical protein
MGDFFAQLWSSLTRRLLTYFMAVLSLGLGVAAFVCLGAFDRSFTDNLRHKTSSSDSTLAAGPTIDLNVGFGPRHKGGGLEAEWVNRQVRQALGTGTAAMTTATFDVKVGRRAIPGMKVFVVSGDWLKLQPHFSWITNHTAGRELTPQDDSSGEAVGLISENLAKAFESEQSPIGKTINVNGKSFRVVGAVASFYKQGEYGLLLISLSAAYDLLRLQPPGSMDFLIKADEKNLDSEMNRARNAVISALGRDYQVSASSQWQELEEFRYQLKYMHIFLGLLCLLPLVVGLLGLVSMLLANLNNRVREIGLYRALGATRLRQAVLVLGEAGLTGLIASLVGIVLGLGLLHLLETLWGSELPVTSGGMIAAVSAGIVTALLAGLIPARAAMRISPAESLRAE